MSELIKFGLLGKRMLLLRLTPNTDVVVNNLTDRLKKTGMSFAVERVK